jgi:aminopeptidase-like protein
VLNQSDGSNSLLDIAEKSRLPFDVVAEAADALTGVELLRRVEPSPGRKSAS